MAFAGPKHTKQVNRISITIIGFPRLSRARIKNREPTRFGARAGDRLVALKRSDSPRSHEEHEEQSKVFFEPYLPLTRFDQASRPSRLRGERFKVTGY